MENVFEYDKVSGERVPSYQMGGWWMLGFRAGLGYLTAVITALVVESQFQKYGIALLKPLARPSQLPLAEEEGADKRTAWQRISNVAATALHDFVDITVFLILGALLAAGTRLFLTPDQIALLGKEYFLLAILAMMGLAILLCLCSEADAFVAASFVTLRPSAKLSFLVLGPMMDFKLLLMYTRIFQTRLIVTIYSCVIVQVLLYSVATHFFWEQYAPYLINPVLVRGQQMDDASRDQLLARAGQTLGLLQPTPAGGAAFAPATAAMGMLLLSTSNDALELRFSQLENAATTPELRNFYDGRRVRLIGRFSGTETVFRLLRYRINCCAADAQPINVPMVVDPSSKQTLPANQLRDKWVEVIGEIRFAQRPSQPVYQTVLVLRPSENEPLVADANKPKASPLVRVLSQAPANPFVD